MFLDKSLLLKGVAGAAALGGVGGAGIYYREEIKGVFSGSSSNAGAGVQADALPQQAQAEDERGIPTKCTADSNPCSLTLEELKKIKFKDLDGNGADSTEPTSITGTVTLTITPSGDSKKYTFNNSGSEITLKKGSDKTVTLNANATTEFTEEDNSLKKVEGVSQSPQQAQISDVDAQGIPNKCTSNPTNCELTEEDLKKIKFQVLEEEASGEVSVENYPGDNQKITLTIDSTEANNKRYIFNNPSSKEVKIKKGNQKSVTLKSGKTKFTVEGGKLKERTLGSYGLPTDCTQSCTLTSTDLEDINFLALKDGTGNATVSPSGKTVTLTIESSSSKKYKFNNTSDSAITITKGSGDSTKTVTFKASGDTEFTEENGSLKEFVRTTDDRGIPTKCTATGATTPCQLTAEELKNIKFQELEGATGETVTLDPETPNPAITLKISTPSGSNPPKIYTFNNSSNSAVTLTKGSDKKVILDVGDTEFKEDGDKLVSYEDSSFTTINANLGNLKLPNKCKFKSADKTKNSKECNVTVDELKKVEFENKGDGDLTIEGPSSSETIKLEIKKLIKNSDQNKYGSGISDNDPLITFKNESSKITIKGKDNTNIVIPKKSNTEFWKNTSNEESKLSKYKKGLSSVPVSWGILCTSSGSGTNKYSCTPSADGTNIRFFTDSTNSQEFQVNSADNNKNIFTAEENVDDYNLGFKFEVNEAITPTSGSLTLIKGDCYEIKYISQKWGYVKKAK